MQEKRKENVYLKSIERCYAIYNKRQENREVSNYEIENIVTEKMWWKRKKQIQRRNLFCTP